LFLLFIRMFSPHANYKNQCKTLFCHSQYYSNAHVCGQVESREIAIKTSLLIWLLDRIEIHADKIWPFSMAGRLVLSLDNPGKGQRQLGSADNSVSLFIFVAGLYPLQGGTEMSGPCGCALNLPEVWGFAQFIPLAGCSDSLLVSGQGPVDASRSLRYLLVV
jgi:hypothetical protein